jgi:arabinose-5-phosphate isomerase
MSGQPFCLSGRQVIETEAKAIAGLLDQLGPNFERACRLLFACQGHIIVTGLGKSGHIGNKIAATLASTGSPAFFLHAAEANHGDLGMINSKDVVLALSHSGETDELISMIPALKLFNIPCIVMTGNPKSTLAQQATVTLNISIQEEACPLGLTPTSSSTAALVMGDAIAVALLKARGFTSDDFAKVHPRGNLGRRLLLRVANIMHTGPAIPQVISGTRVIDALMEISRKRLGLVVVTNQEQELLGLLTDSDLRRALEKEFNLYTTEIDQIMTKNCKIIDADRLATEALRVMEENKITALVTVDPTKKLQGIVHIHDILSQGIQ